MHGLSEPVWYRKNTVIPLMTDILIPSKLDLMTLIKARMEAQNMTINKAALGEYAPELLPHRDLNPVRQSSWARFDAWHRMMMGDENHPKDWREPDYGHLFSMAHAVGCDWYLVMPM